MLNNCNKNDYLHYITKLTKAHNMDNISRTKAYQTFYFGHKEIQWALLASIVSRNAGWNMTDLSLSPFLNMLGKQELRAMLLTYERANWMIFSDAYPQLLVYHLSKTVDRSLFHLLYHLNVSRFMIKQWQDFWDFGDRKKLVTAMIVNEQNLIQTPVIDKPYFKKRIFRKLPYLLQNMLGMNAVLFPVRFNQLYGFGVNNFTNLTNRIKLGKQLATRLFSASIQSHIIDFITHVEHTGSRRDYEYYLDIEFPHAPPLRRLFPVMHHDDKTRFDWHTNRKFQLNWMDSGVELSSADVSVRYYQKRHLLFAYDHIKRVFIR